MAAPRSLRHPALLLLRTRPALRASNRCALAHCAAVATQGTAVNRYVHKIPIECYIHRTQMRRYATEVPEEGTAHEGIGLWRKKESPQMSVDERPGKAQAMRSLLAQAEMG